ncbi:hypothetical protein BTO02_33200 [Paraburkholderia sp. SOS3]|nr:hypothetical protein BTO02_33200 [Paraburkholderia sp. SOS3]
MSKHRDLHPDAKIIDELGGPTKLAERLGYDKASGGVQRIQNWKWRGIPAHVKVEHPEIFMTDLIDRVKASDDAQPPAGGSVDDAKMAKMVV